MTGKQPEQPILDLLRGPLASSGLDIEAVEIATAGRRRMVRVLVDKDGGVTLDDIAESARSVSGLLDDSDVMGEAPYTLEVTSPGVDRPLTLPRHWRRNVDRLVKVARTDGSTLTGRVKDADDAGATLEVDGQAQTLMYDDVAKARVEVEFNRPRPAREER